MVSDSNAEISCASTDTTLNEIQITAYYKGVLWFLSRQPCLQLLKTFLKQGHKQYVVIASDWATAYCSFISYLFSSVIAMGFDFLLALGSHI